MRASTRSRAADYALFRTLYLAGLRAGESASFDRADVHFGRGPFGKVHVHFGKGAKTSGPRPRWVPMLDGLDLILGWYLAEIAPRLGEGPALFCDEGGGRISRGTIRNRLAHLLDLEVATRGETGPRPAGLVRFSPHTLRHACEHWNGERADTSGILVLAGKAKAFRSIDRLLARKGGHQVSPGSAQFWPPPSAPGPSSPTRHQPI